MQVNLTEVNISSISKQFGGSCLGIRFLVHSLVISLAISEHGLVPIEKNYKNKTYLWEHCKSQNSPGSEALSCDPEFPCEDSKIIVSSLFLFVRIMSSVCQ